MKTVKSHIWVTFQREGIHRYPAAVNIPGVEFLQHPHRHIFHFKVKVEVFHDDRDIEFILLKRELEKMIAETPAYMDFKSCEMLAAGVLKYMQLTYPHRDIEVDVSEDGENGATLVYERE